MPLFGHGDAGAQSGKIKWRLDPQVNAPRGASGHDVRNTLPLLANGGRLVYATCSLNRRKTKRGGEGVPANLRAFESLLPTSLRWSTPG